MDNIDLNATGLEAARTAAYAHLGIYSDWVTAVKPDGMALPMSPPGPDTCQRVREVLGMNGLSEEPPRGHRGTPLGTGWRGG